MLSETDIQKIREDFPILRETVYGKPLVYLDNAATTQKPICVLSKIDEGYRTRNANVHRGVHFLSQVATEAHEQARQTVQQFIHAARPSEIVFTRGTTESINLVAYSFGETFMQTGDEVLISVMEHHSNIVPWQLLRDRKGIVLKAIPFLPDGQLDREAFTQLLSAKTKLLAITQVSNVLGTVNPVKELIQEAHARGIPVLVDAAQSIPHLPVDVQDMDADFLVFSGHKVYGPTGIGVLYGKEKWLEQMVPYQGGGEMIDRVRLEQTTYNVLPYKFEAGTPDFIGSTALAEALRYVQTIGMPAIAARETALLHYAIERLKTLVGLRIFGEAPQKSGVISMQLGHIHHYDMGTLLDKLGLALRTGHHCAQPVMDYFGIEGTLRASLAIYNTQAEIDALVEGLQKAARLFV